MIELKYKVRRRQKEDKFGTKSKKGEKGNGGRKSLWVSITLSLAPFILVLYLAYLCLFTMSGTRRQKNVKEFMAH